MPADEDEINAAVSGANTRLAQMSKSVNNIPSLPPFLKAAVARIVAVTIHDVEQQIRKALNDKHEVEPWVTPTPEELAKTKTALDAVEEDDGLDDLRKEMQNK